MPVASWTWVKQELKCLLSNAYIRAMKYKGLGNFFVQPYALHNVHNDGEREGGVCKLWHKTQISYLLHSLNKMGLYVSRDLKKTSQKFIFKIIQQPMKSEKFNALGLASLAVNTSVPRE